MNIILNDQKVRVALSIAISVLTCEIRENSRSYARLYGEYVPEELLESLREEEEALRVLKECYLS